MYVFLFDSKLLTAAAALLLVALSTAFAGDPRLWWRLLAYNFAPAFGAAFFLVAPLAPADAPLADLLGCLLFEFAVLCAYSAMFRSLYRVVQRIEDDEASLLLRRSLWLQIPLAVSMLSSEGFGIFSEGSRIDYLYDGALSKYVTYAGVLLMAAQGALVANRVSRSGRLGVTGAVVLVANFGISVAGGSKGGIFLWLFSVLALVDFGRRRVRFATIAALAAGAAVALYVSSVVVADFLGIGVEEFANLALSRFFLNNDARALAFEYRGTAGPGAALLAESFRSLATLFGTPPQNAPLGVHLYGELFGIESTSGANASLTALIVYYSAPGYAAIPAMIATAFVPAFYFFFRAVQRSLKRASSRALVLVGGMFAVQQLSQDFLAFQVAMPLVLLYIGAVWMHDHRYVTRHRIPQGRRRFAAADQRRHSRA